VARIPRDLEALPVEISRRLTEAELEEFQNFLSSRSEAAALRRKLAAHEIDVLAAMVAEELANTKDERELAFLSARMNNAIQTLRGALARQRGGHQADARPGVPRSAEPSERG
jgi:hypothetical protein